MKLKHSIALISVLFCLGCSSGEDPKSNEGPSGKCREVNPETSIDKDGNQIFHGKKISCWANGQMKENKEYDHGKFVGSSTEWHEDGQIASERNFTKEGKSNGKFSMWYKDGVKERESEYRNGISYGKSYDWHEDGTKKRETHFDDKGNTSLIISYDDLGRKTMEIEYQNDEKETTTLRTFDASTGKPRTTSTSNKEGADARLIYNPKTGKWIDATTVGDFLLRKKK